METVNTEKTQHFTLNQGTVMEHLSLRRDAYLRHVQLLPKEGILTLRVLPHLLASLVQSRVKRKWLKQIQKQEVHQWMGVRMDRASLTMPVMTV